MKWILNIFKKKKKETTLSEKEKYSLIGEYIVLELKRNRNFRRDVANLPLGIKIINIANDVDKN